MSYEISGKIIAILPLKSYISQISGALCGFQRYVIETNDRPSKKLCFEVAGIKRIELYNIQLGDELTVCYDIDAKEYRGRWYNFCREWKLERTQAPHKTAATDSGL